MYTEYKKLIREINIHNLLKTENRSEFEKEHTVCYGLYDDEGIEVLNKVSEITVDSLDVIVKATNSYNIRARMNSHRNTTVYLMWLHNKHSQHIDKLLEQNDYMRAKALLLKHGYKC